MSVLIVLALVAAGAGAGLVGSIAGLASVVSYPALLALGLDPVSANVTNTLGLVALTGSSVVSSRPELKGNVHRLVGWLPICIAGGLTGAGLLLISSPGAFEKVAPVLIIGSSVVVFLRPRLLSWRSAAAARRVAGRGEAGPPGPLFGPDASPPWWFHVGLFLVTVYAGYFGAAAGVLVLALLLLTIEPVTARAMAMRAGTLGVANGVAAVWFVFSGRVHWSFLPPLIAGMALGGWLGPKVNRRLPDSVLRIGVATVGLAVGLQLFVRAYLR